MFGVDQNYSNLSAQSNNAHWQAHVHADFVRTFGGSSGNGNQQHLQQNLNFFTRKNHGQTICFIKALLLRFVWWRCNSPSHGRCKKLSRHESGRILVTRWLQWLDGPTEQMTWMVTRWLQWLDGITEQMLSGMVEDITSGCTLKYNTFNIDFTPPFRRIDMIEQRANLQIPKDLSSDEA